MVTITRTCPLCEKDTSLTVPAAQYEAWQSGTLVQQAFPDMNKDDREILMTGICSPCFEEMWNNADEDDEV